MLAITRFQDPGADFERRAGRVVEFWRAKPGCVRADLVRNLDDEDLWAIVSEWSSVGDYRRSFQGYEAKLLLTEVLLEAVDEPSAYLTPEELRSPIW